MIFTNTSIQYFRFNILCYNNLIFSNILHLTIFEYPDAKFIFLIFIIDRLISFCLFLDIFKNLHAISCNKLINKFEMASLLQQKLFNK